MKAALIVLSGLTLTSTAYAKKNCTDQPKGKWMSIEAFKSMASENGYQIRKFKQKGSCYEIYGKNKQGQKVEVYFNPVDGSVVKSEIED
ncbi:MAG: PepSY domain-containing protein [Bdellovibrionaceae bacterium]|jgi:hypothetical protein|nr:PepSY domain-containing protein [Pseudobdellovibrionaceae bacterium]